MSAGVGSGSGSGGRRGSGSQDFELNLAPIIDCFTVLITFMLASASFLSIGIFDAGIAAAGAQAEQKTTPPPINITIELNEKNVMKLKLTGKETRTISIPSEGEAWDYEKLTQNLQSLKDKYPTVNAVTITANDSVAYQEIVGSMEKVRKVMPMVLLGGF